MISIASTSMKTFILKLTIISAIKYWIAYQNISNFYKSFTNLQKTCKWKCVNYKFSGQSHIRNDLIHFTESEFCCSDLMVHEFIRTRSDVFTGAFYGLHSANKDLVSITATSMNIQHPGKIYPKQF